jgi:hypothetical protein
LMLGFQLSGKRSRMPLLKTKPAGRRTAGIYPIGEPAANAMVQSG